MMIHQHKVAADKGGSCWAVKLGMVSCCHVLHPLNESWQKVSGCSAPFKDAEIALANKKVQTLMVLPPRSLGMVVSLKIKHLGWSTRTLRGLNFTFLLSIFIEQMGKSFAPEKFRVLPSVMVYTQDFKDIRTMPKKYACRKLGADLLKCKKHHTFSVPKEVFWAFDCVVFTAVISL